MRASEKRRENLRRDLYADTHCQSISSGEMSKRLQHSSVTLIVTDYNSITPPLPPSSALPHIDGSLITTDFLLRLLLSQKSAAAPHALRLSADHAGGGADVLHAVQTEVMPQIGEQHQRWGVQLQLLPTQDRALRWYV